MALTVSRFAGKYLGTLLGGRIAHTDPAMTKNLGLSLLPAAGVMVGLTLNARDSFGEALGSYGDAMVAIVIGATLINEFLTPFFVRFAIRRQAWPEILPTGQRKRDPRRACAVTTVGGTQRKPSGWPAQIYIGRPTVLPDSDQTSRGY